MEKKLPSRDQLLAEQNNSDSQDLALDNASIDSVQKAKDAAEIAEQKNREITAKIKAEMQQKGYIDVQQAFEDAKRKQEEADMILAHIKEMEQEVEKRITEANTEKQRAVDAFEMIKQREESVDARLRQAIMLENARNVESNGYKTLRDELITLMEYHSGHIIPCRKALLNVSRAIYNWAGVLQDSKIDFINLYNYIGTAMKEIDKYIDRVPSEMKQTKLLEAWRCELDVGKSDIEGTFR